MFHVKPEHENIYNQLSGLGIILSNKQIEQIDCYCQLIKMWSGRKNLVSNADLEKLMVRHVVPSIYLAWVCKETENKRIADIGAGSGFLGIIIKLLYPNKTVYLIDSSRKKYLFLVESCESLNIDCMVVHERVEKIAACISEQFDLIVCRAVAPLQMLWRWSRPLLKEGGALYALKGGNIKKETEKLDECKLSVSVIKPDIGWINLSADLKSKFVIHVKEKYGRE